MSDERIEQYARLLVDRCVDVKPGWQVIVQSNSHLSTPLFHEVLKRVAERGAYALPRMAFASSLYKWARHVSTDILPNTTDIERYAAENADAYIIIDDPINTRDGSALGAERLNLLMKAWLPARDRRLKLEVPWVGCQFPTPALAQDAGMTLSDFEDFLFGACLLDWDEEAMKMRRLADRFDKASEVRIVGAGTDINIGLDGREAMIDDGHLNMPGGEFFYSPVEDATHGVVTFSEFPAVYAGNEVKGVRLAYEAGRVVDASAESNEEFLIKTLDSDDGARVLGELGIGCNPRITKHMKNVLFDEKIYGTIHMAVGAGFSFIGGKNVSNVHWDMVKDLRISGEIYCDGELVQKDGAWTF